MRRRRGYTLIELLVAAGLASMLLFLSAQVFTTTMRSRDRLRERAADTGALQRAYETISRDLHSATVPPDDSGLQFGLSATSAGTANNVLQLASIVGEPLLAGRAANETALIQYAVAEDPQSGRPALWRYETPYPVPDATSGTAGEPERAFILVPRVVQASYLFYSSAQQNWVETWDGEVGLPAAIRIDLELENAAAEEEPRVESWTFALPSAQFETDEANAAAEAESTEAL